MPGPPQAPAVDLEVSLLGPTSARRGDEELALGGRRQRAVLARLAIASGEVVPVERLVDDLWRGDPPPSAVNTLQSYVSNLRRLLGPAPGDGSAIARVGDGYRLALPADSFVAVRFAALVRDGALDALDRALTLWRGAALADVAEEEWARGEAVRLDELRLTAVEARFDRMLAAGRHAEAVVELESAVVAEPLRERLAAQLVLALYRCGRQADALRAYERTRRVLAEELGLDPGPELAALAAQVLAHDAVLMGEAGPGVAAPVPVPEPAEALALPPAVAERRRRSRFVGRADEVDVLDRSWADVVAGDRRMVVLSGEPGIGKTRLALRFAQRVHDGGGHVLWGRCSAEHPVAYQPVVEALRTVLRSLPSSNVASVLASRPALGRLVPDLDPSALDAPGRQDRHDLHDDVTGFLGTLAAEAPVLLAVDDLQWADVSTLDLLDHLLRTDRTGRVLLVATVRRPAGRPTPDLDRLALDVRRQERLVELDLAGVGPAAVADLLADLGVLVGDAEAEAVRERTGGNPFFIEALALDGGDLLDGESRSIPTSVRELLDQRIGSLDPASAAMLSVAAVIGQRVELHLLGVATGLEPSGLLDLVDEAVAGGLLVEDEELGWVAFPHALVRQGLLARLTRNREAQLHLAVADAIEASTPWSGRAVAMAGHLIAAGPASSPRRTAEAAVDAARAALAALADADALAWVERGREALGIAADGSGPDHPDPDLRAALDLVSARAARNLARVDVASVAVGRVVDHARQHGDGPLLARAAQEAAQLGAGVGFAIGAVDDELVAMLTEALDAVPADELVDRARLLAWKSIALSGLDDPGPRSALADEAWALAERIDRAEVTALAAYARRLARSGADGLVERLRVGPIMLAASRRAGWVELEVLGLVLTVVDLVEADRVPEARATLEEVRVLLARGDRPVFDVYVHFIDGCFALLEGDLVGATAQSDLGLTVGEEAHGGNASQGWAAQQFLIAGFRGEQAPLAPIVAELAEAYPTMPAWKAALATCLLAAGDVDGARSAASAALDGGDHLLQRDQTGSTAVAQLAEVAWALGDSDLAARLLPLVAPIADRIAVSSMGAISVGHLARYHGLVLALLGRTDDAVAALATAVDRARACGFTPYLARASAELAAVLIRRGGPGDTEAAAAAAAEAEELVRRLDLHRTELPTGST